jgi:predicted nucleotidyltransferase
VNVQIARSEKFSERRVTEIRTSLRRDLQDQDYVVVANGSYARREASLESDLDYFLICDSEKACVEARKRIPKIRGILKKHVKRDPALGGAFGEAESIGGMVKDIGGSRDTNAKITRRILFLMEGEWLFNESKFVRYRDALVSKYLRRSISDHQFCRFLLNDLIRYYRTICVDFEHKTQEQGKAWGTRNIKLVFSRKLLYFSGILVAAETWQHSYETKLARLQHLLSLTPLQRIGEICGHRAEQALKLYGRFLEQMGDARIRKLLDAVPDRREQQPEEFRILKNDGHHFSWMLTKLLKDTYDLSHPIHNALIV